MLDFPRLNSAMSHQPFAREGVEMTEEMIWHRALFTGKQYCMLGNFASAYLRSSTFVVLYFSRSMIYEDIEPSDWEAWMNEATINLKMSKIFTVLPHLLMYCHDFPFDIFSTKLLHRNVDAFNPCEHPHHHGKTWTHPTLDGTSIG